MFKIKFYIIYYLRIVYAYLFCPQVCLICGANGKNGLPICFSCKQREFDSIIDLRQKNPQCSCRKCGKLLISEINLCTACRSELYDNNGRISFCNRVFTLFPYKGKGGICLSEWKHENLRGFAKFFSEYIALFIRFEKELDEAVIVPVPPRPKKLKTKGWDQIDDMVNYLHSMHGFPVLRCLKRFDGISQKILSKKDRIINLQGKISFISTGKIPKKVLILDDIITTGSTLSFCAKALKEAGCEEIYGLCIFFD